MIDSRRVVQAEPRPTAPSGVSPGPARWLLLVHQLPARPSNLRVRTWRRLQQLGAIAVKQAAYVLPDSSGAREDFEWLKTEIEAAGGEASVFAAATVDRWSDDALVEQFRRSRQDDYAALAREVERVLPRGARSRRRPRRAPTLARRVERFRQQLAALERIDFFGSAGRDRVATLLSTLEEHAAGRRAGSTDTHGGSDSAQYRGRLWVTRPRPGVDRMSSAWLIRRFIDPDARFAFVSTRDTAPAGAVPFDMFGVDFTHRGDRCTFETLCAEFGLKRLAHTRIAAIVHDLDLKDGRFGAPEATSVGLIVEGLQLAYADDADLLAAGMTVFDALYRALERSRRAAGPRAVAGRKRARTSK
jgi:hypothetical protein